MFVDEFNPMNDKSTVNNVTEYVSNGIPSFRSTSGKGAFRRETPLRRRRR